MRSIRLLRPVWPCFIDKVIVICAAQSRDARGQRACPIYLSSGPRSLSQHLLSILDQV